MQRTALTALAIIIATTDVARAAIEEQACSYTLTPLTLSVSGTGGSGQITVSTGAGCSWSASGTSWVSVSPASGVGSGTVTWTAAPNPLRSQRFGSFLIAGRAIFISQTQGTAMPSVPGAPRSLTASVAGSSLTLTWSPPDSGGTPSSYAVAAGSDTGLSNIANFATGSTQTTFSASQVPSGVYFLRVSAQNAAGVGPASNEVTVAVESQPCAVTPPTGLQSAVSGSLVTLTWIAPAGGTPASYLLEVGSSPTLTDLASFNTGSPATTFAANAPPGNYFVRVRAVSSCGVSAPTADVTIAVTQ